MTQQYGNVYLQWHMELMKKYLTAYDYETKLLNSIPSFPHFITDTSENKLRLLCEIYEIPTENINLKEVKTFYKYKGKVIKARHDRVEIFLKPVDTHKDLLLKTMEDGKNDQNHDIY